MPYVNYRKNTRINPKTSDDRALSQRQKIAVKKIARNIASKTGMNKRLVLNCVQGNALAGQGYFMNPLAGIQFGNTSSTRLSNNIRLLDIAFNLQVLPLGALTNSTLFSVYAYWTDEEIFTSTSSFTAVTNSNLTVNTPLIGATAIPTDLMIDPIQATPVFQEHLYHNPPISASSQARCLVKKMKFGKNGKTIKFLETVSTSYLNGKNLYFGVVVDSVGSTIGTTQVCNLNLTYMVKWRE